MLRNCYQIVKKLTFGHKKGETNRSPFNISCIEIYDITPLEGVFSVHYISAHINPNNTLELYPNPYKFSEWEKWVSKKGQKVGESGRMWYFMVNTLSYELLLISIFNYW